MKHLSLELLLVFSLLIPSVKTHAQATEINIVDTIATRFQNQYLLFPQEKIYTQLDKQFYVSGEDIWFRAHLVNALTHMPDSSSRYIYAELIDPIDNVVKRVKVRSENGTYPGHISLPEDMAEGNYQLRFYTRFMENLGDDYFFKRAIRIGTPLSALYHIKSSIDYTDNNNKVIVELQFLDNKNDEPITPEEVRVRDEKGEVKIMKLNEEQKVRYSINAKKGNKDIIYVEFDYSGKFHKEYIPVTPPNDFDVTFHPEGGNLPTGVLSRIAFKAVNSKGYGEDISLILMDEQGDTLLTTNSVHLGMGYFSHIPTEDKKYTIICKNNQSVEKQFELPVASTHTASLETIWNRERLFIKVNTSTNFPTSSPLMILIQSRGQVLGVIPWDFSKEYTILPKETLPTGVIQFSLLQEDLQPISERLIFNISENDLAKVSFKTNKATYAKREKVHAEIQLNDIEDIPLEANLSLSVIDSHDIQPDTSINILSSMLLTSELKGYIESPAYYFKEKSYERTNELDLLMMTQGWRRYDIEKVLKAEYSIPETQIEIGPRISGSVKGGLLLTKNANSYPITLLSMNYPLLGETQTDSEGKFLFSDFDAPDSTIFIIQARTPKDGARAELQLDKEVFPSAKFTLPFSYKQEDSSFESYIKKADQHFTHRNGIRMIYLDEVTVTAKKRSTRGKSSFSSAISGTRMTLEEIEKFRPQSVFDILRRMAGVMVSGTNSVSIRGGGEPLVLIDDIPRYVEDLNYIIVEDIDEVEVIKDAGAAIFGIRGGNGVILITTKRGDFDFQRPPPLNIKNTTPLGYQTKKEFYSPKYETQEEKRRNEADMRTTIYWNPTLAVSEEGKASFDFYTADADNDYLIIIEGVTDEGQLVYDVQTITRKP